MTNPLFGTFNLPRKPRKGDWIIWQGDDGSEYESLVHHSHRRHNTITVTAPHDFGTPLATIGVDQVMRIVHGR